MENLDSSLLGDTIEASYVVVVLSELASIIDFFLSGD
jgi:hypothetical protein